MTTPEPPATPQVRTAALVDIDPATLYRILRLRVDVFVVEQACPYPELDGRDLEPSARHCWVADDAGEAVLGYLRVLHEPDGSARIGRVVTATHARGHGLAGLLLRHAIDLVGPRPARLDAQAHLAGWYAGFGFTPSGPGFLEDGIPHVPMSMHAPVAAVEHHSDAGRHHGPHP